MKYILRKQSVITGKKNLKSLYTFKKFPVFFGCVTHGSKKDIRADMSWSIDPDTGIIQLDKLIPLNILYQSQHMDSVGKTWLDHNENFAKYISKQKPNKVLEIGGGPGKLADATTEMNKRLKWTIVEANPLHKETDQIKIISAFFDEHFNKKIELDTIVFSHVLEHAYNPQGFISKIYDYLNKGQKLIFSYPNLTEWLKEKFTNAINFEHTVFLTDYFVDYLLTKQGFKITDKTYYGKHSIFYTAVKSKKINKKLENKYSESKKYFDDFISYYQKLIKSFNEQITNFPGKVYLFGGHIFSQYLLEFGLDSKKITAILDNSKLKEGKRLYGSTLYVQNPKVIKKLDKVAVILKAGVHQNEVSNQLRKINPQVVILE